MKPRRSILLVEDEENDGYFFTRAARCSALDAQIHVVNDGQAAVEFLSKATPSGKAASAPISLLILLDLNLPLKSGLEVLAWIRQHPIWKTAVVIVLTSSTAEADMKQAYALGANSYIIKPTDASKLNEVVRPLKDYWFVWNQLPHHWSAPLIFPATYFASVLQNRSIRSRPFSMFARLVA